MQDLFVIQNINAPHLYWNNESGYGYLSTALVVSAKGKQKFLLPIIEGQWVTLEQAVLNLENIAEAHGVDL